MRTALIVLSLLFRIFISAQTPQVLFSKNFPGGNKSVPLQLLNNHSDYFLVLRYNKQVHDFFVERRSKPGFDFQHVTPLKLDSVNAGWFDYENLDYLFFEQGKTAYFVFEKMLNNSSEIFVKTIDSTGHASGFQQIHALHTDAKARIMDLDFQLASKNRLLIVSSQNLNNGNVLKRVTLFDLNERKVVWNKMLPVENQLLSETTTFTCDEQGDLYYYSSSYHLVNFRRKYSGFNQLQLPVFFYDSLCLVLSRPNNKTSYKTLLVNSPYLQAKNIFTHNNKVLASFRFGTENETGKIALKFFAGIYDNSLQDAYVTKIHEMDSALVKRLTYYDGTDSPDASEKEFTVKTVFAQPEVIVGIEERIEENYSKELFVWKIEKANAEVSWQEVVPRKIYFFRERSRFRYLGEVALINTGGETFCALLENKSNRKVEPGTVSYSKFRKQNEVKSGALVAYRLGTTVDKSRKISVFESADYDFVPLKYSGSAPDLVFYLNRGKAEKFAIWTPAE